MQKKKPENKKSSKGPPRGFLESETLTAAMADVVTQRCDAFYEGLMSMVEKKIVLKNDFASPNSAAAIWGSYGKGKSIWCIMVVCASVPRFCVDPLGEKPPRVLDEVHFGGAFSHARRVDFRKSGMQNARVLRRVQDRRKGCSKVESVKNLHVSWQAQFFALLESVLESSKCPFCETLTSFRVAVTGLRMPRTHFSWQAQYTCVAKYPEHTQKGVLLCN